MATLCISGAVLRKAGKDVSADLSATGALGQSADEMLNEMIEQAESEINVLTRIDWVAIFSTLTNARKLILEKVCASLAAMDAVSYDMSNYPAGDFARTTLNVLDGIVQRGLSIIRDDTEKKFIKGT